MKTQKNNSKHVCTLFSTFAFKEMQNTIKSQNLYTGIGRCKITALNPTLLELNALYNNVQEEEPNYNFIDEVGRKSVMLKFYLDVTSPEDSTISFKSSIIFFIKEQLRTNKDNTKIQLINKFGQTLWIDINKFKDNSWKTDPKYTWYKQDGVRAAHTGEENLIKFIKTYLNIPNPQYINENNIFMDIENLDDAACQFSENEINDWFNGIFNDLKKLITLVPKNSIKCLFGIKFYNNKQYQTIYPDMYLHPYSKRDLNFKENVFKSQQMGMYTNCYFNLEDLKLQIYTNDLITNDNDLKESIPQPIDTTIKPTSINWAKIDESNKSKDGLPF